MAQQVTVTLLFSYSSVPTEQELRDVLERAFECDVTDIEQEEY